jgi:shikimate kinase
MDLDILIEEAEGSSIAEIIDKKGIENYRSIETRCLETALEDPDTRILSLGGGTWTVHSNRQILAESGFIGVWLESTFEHCWLNIAFSKKDRPLARDKQSALELFEERQKVYCLADWHFIVRPDYTSFEVAKEIAEQIFGL